MQTHTISWRFPPFGSALEQAYVRVGVTAIFAAFVVFDRLGQSSTIPDSALYWVSSYFVLGLAYAFWRKVHPDEGPYQRTAAIIIDQSCITLCMYTIGMDGWLFLFVMSWSAVGYGIRHGLHWLVLSTAASVIGLSFLIATYPVFDQYPRLGHAIIMMQLMIPLYVAYLVKRMRATQTSLVAQTRELESLAYRDHLTGLTNRGGFDKYLDAAVAQTEITHKGCALLYFDLDGFKRVNDTYGHALGDALLVRLSQDIRGSLRSDVLFARLGGDEFAMLITGADVEAAAQRVARDVLSACSAIDSLDGAKIAVSASIGCAFYQQHERTSSLVKRADTAMYQSKKAGKNRLTIASNDSASTTANAAGVKGRGATTVAL